MTVMKLLTYPNNRLREIAIPVKKVDKNIQKIVDNMLETMYERDGIGLAATQVNLPQQIIVIDISTLRNEPLVLINPEFLEKTGSISLEEGCLSIPQQRAFIPRSKTVKIMALDLQNHPFTIEANNLMAVCIQHEMDHLVGKLFIDYLSPIKRHLIHQRLQKLEKKFRRKLRNRTNII
ncbi:MAG: peptide deformylase [Candidatus Dasytiphilus stammeri]